MRILIIDDMPERHRLIERLCRKQIKGDLSFFAATNADDAMGALTAERFDLVFFDHDLGHGGTGLDVARFVGTVIAIKPSRALVHSSNTVGAAEIVRTLADAGVPARTYSLVGLGGF